MSGYTYPINRKGWNLVSTTYENVWKNAFKRWQSFKEVTFIKKFYLQKKKLLPNLNILDIGIGTGRILKIYMDNNEKKVYGLDYAENMIKNIKKKYKNDIILKTGDISKDKIPFKKKFDFISAIRVFKYISNWKFALQNIVESLNNNGILVISFTNMNSISALSGDKVTMLSYNTILSEFKKNNLEIIDSEGFSRLPELLYKFEQFTFFYIIIENLLHLFFPKHLVSKEIFIATRKI